MEAIAGAISAIAGAAAGIAWAFAAIYIVGFGTKTFLLYNECCKPEDLQDWFKIWRESKGKKL